MKRLTLLHLVLQNLRRMPYRAAAIVMCVATAAGALFSATLVMRGMNNSLRTGLARLGADLVVVPTGQAMSVQEVFITGQPTTFYMDQEVERKVGLVQGVARTSSQVFIKTLSNARCCVGEFFLVGFDPETDFTIRPWLMKHLDRPLENDELIVGDRILLRAGEDVTFYGSSFAVEGVLEATGMGMDQTVFVPIQGVRDMIAASSYRAEMPLQIGTDQVSIVLAQLTSGVDPLDVAEDIEGRILGVSVVTSSRLKQAVGQRIQGLKTVVVSVIGILWCMSLILIGLIFSLMVNERCREIGLLRAMGARQRVVSQLVLEEAAVLTGLGGGTGIAVSAILLFGFEGLLRQRLQIPYLWPPMGETASLVGVLCALALLTGALASLYPAIRSSRLEPYQAIRRGP